jgi:PIN domain nuclease of toxin-antitoxin system
MNNILWVLDASALLALFHRENGADAVATMIRQDRCAVCTVNYCEVVGKIAALGKSTGEFRRTFAELPILQVAFDETLAYEAGRLQPRTKEFGLSIADRACLTLAQQLGVPAVTADRIWKRLEPEFEVELIR